jgi:hypothetical protein
VAGTDRRIDHRVISARACANVTVTVTVVPTWARPAAAAPGPGSRPGAWATGVPVTTQRQRIGLDLGNRTRR